LIYCANLDHTGFQATLLFTSFHVVLLCEHNLLSFKILVNIQY